MATTVSQQTYDDNYCLFIKDYEKTISCLPPQSQGYLPFRDLARDIITSYK